MVEGSNAILASRRCSSYWSGQDIKRWSWTLSIEEHHSSSWLARSSHLTSFDILGTLSSEWFAKDTTGDREAPSPQPFYSRRRMPLVIESSPPHQSSLDYSSTGIIVRLSNDLIRVSRDSVKRSVKRIGICWTWIRLEESFFLVIGGRVPLSRWPFVLERANRTFSGACFKQANDIFHLRRGPALMQRGWFSRVAGTERPIL